MASPTLARVLRERREEEEADASALLPAASHGQQQGLIESLLADAGISASWQRRHAQELRGGGGGL